MAGRSRGSRRACFEELKGRLADLKKRLKGVLDTDLADFNKTAQEQGIPPVTALPKEEKK